MRDDLHLISGDAIEAMAALQPKSVDLVLVDPPYGTTACKWDEVIPIEPMWREIRRVLRADGAAVFTASQPFTSTLVASNFRGFRQALVWSKNKPSGHLNAKRRHLTAHEDILVFSDQPATYNPQKWHSRPANGATQKTYTPVYGSQRPTTYAGGNTERYPTSVLDFAVVNNDGTGDGRFHPAQKPVALMEYLIRTYSNQGETVLDFAMGSGTTGVACVKLGRRFVGIELTDDYVSIARGRITKTQVHLNLEHA